MNAMKLAGVSALVLLLSACGGGSEEPTDAASDTAEATEATEASAAPVASESVAAADSSAEPVTFAQCKACHSVKAGENGIGPSLAGIVGTKAGDVAGYEFSTAMKASGLTWDEATLDKYLTDPRAVVPGTKMSFPGIKDDAKRKEVIEYLKTL